jgi:hypothetical protein
MRKRRRLPALNLIATKHSDTALQLNQNFAFILMTKVAAASSGRLTGPGRSMPLWT